MPPVSEAVREHDLQRYLQPWLDAQDPFDWGHGRANGLTYETYQPRSSRDKALIAFAQLAALRLDVRRAMVSLIDLNRQYILAEATKTLLLFSQSAEREGDELWLGHTIINRADAVCHHTFGSTYVALEQDGKRYEADALVIPDCRDDVRFSSMDYVTSEKGVRFYAGVPITTKAGHTIGVYAVSDEMPRASLNAAEVRFMQDVSAAVMEHLELAKDSDDRDKGELMVRGLTEFIERSSAHELRNTPSDRPTTMEKQTENARLHSTADEPTSPPTTEQQLRKREVAPELDVARIFHRAARIIRQSTRADGVVFFDTSAAHIRGHECEHSSPIASSDESPRSHSSTTASTTTSKKRARFKRDNLERNHSIANVGFPNPPAGSSMSVDSKTCPVIGLSVRAALTPVPDPDFIFTERHMERYTYHYPEGKFFNFDSEGAGINSCDERSEKSDPEQLGKITPVGKVTRISRKRREQFIPTEILKFLPNVRSLIFLPLWDPASERWTAGGFIWTMASGRLMSPENELPYLKAFGKCITSEVGRFNARKSDRAKTTFIASISHELRSPLHGILGSVEFLRDAVSSAYQQSLVSSIETCGKTLLDTIDHVLDHAKINKLRLASSKRKQRADTRMGRLAGENSILGVTTVFNVAQIVEEVLETVCAGYTFTQHIDTTAFQDQGTRSRTTSELNKDTLSHQVTAGPKQNKDRVVVTLNSTPFAHWIVRSQPGALRRIIMNLLGNSLKYTETGFITVGLHQDNCSSRAVDFTLIVEDSGRGMSKEYQRTKLFAPFSQEDPFSSGTGLGLSIVKQIVQSLGGEIEVRSTVNAGTKVTVTLSLPEGVPQQARTHQTLTESPERLKGKTAAILLSLDYVSEATNKIRESMMQACRGFYMEITDQTNFSESTPDFLLTAPKSLRQIMGEQLASENTSSRHSLAVICLCTDTATKFALETRIDRDYPSLKWVIETAVQPCGPRKLAKMLLDAQSRASERADSLQIRQADSSGSPAQCPEPPLESNKIQRRMSDMVGGSSNVLPPTSRVHSPLISATMPTTSHSTSRVSDPSIPETPASEVPSDYSGPRLLLVDDNAINLKLLVVFAKRHHLLFEEATNGLEAFEKYKTKAMSSSPPAKPFDFVLMDLSMPIMGGLESTNRIRRFELEHSVPKCTIVALTGLASGQDQQDAIDAGVDMYLVKPVKFADITRLFDSR